MDKDIEQLRKIYLKQKLPTYLEKHGLADARFKLEEREQPSIFLGLKRFSLGFGVSLVLVFAFLVFLTENSHPGPTKKVSSDVTNKAGSGSVNLNIPSPENLSSPSAQPKLKGHFYPKPSPKNGPIDFSQFLLNPTPTTSRKEANY